MARIIRIALEENDRGVMLHLVDMPGAFTRGKNLDEALGKVVGEARAYETWVGIPENGPDYDIEIVQRETTNARLDDGDTEILVCKDKELDANYLQQLKMLALKTANDFQRLYDSIPDPEFRDNTKERTTFYGKVPASAREMLQHVDQVNGYYLSRVNIRFSESKDNLVANRYQCLRLIEADQQAKANMLTFIDNEYWTTAKALRRFIWHDRIHARALYRFAVRAWGREGICDPFCFEGAPR